MKKIVVVILSLFMIVIVFFMFAPEDRINTVIEYKRRTTNDPGQRCFDYVKKKLKDPDSARYVSYEKDNQNRIVIHYKAKNGYGAYVNGSDVCSINSDGKVDEALTEADNVLYNLKQQNEEFNKKNAIHQ